MKAAVITAYVEGDLSHLVEFEEADYIICADGGLNLAIFAGITPDVIIGDFDSMTCEQAEIPDGVLVEQLPTHKDVTDTAAALEYAYERGFTEAVIFGGMGGRLDHTMANIQNIFGYMKKGMSVKMVDERNTVMALWNASAAIERVDGRKLSLFSFSEECSGVSVSGVEYPLDDYTMTSDFPLGVSNEFVDERAYVNVKKGKLLIVLSRDK